MNPQQMDWRSISSSTSSDGFRRQNERIRPPPFNNYIFDDLYQYYLCGSDEYVSFLNRTPVRTILRNAPERIPQQGISVRMKNLLAFFARNLMSYEKCVCIACDEMNVNALGGPLNETTKIRVFSMSSVAMRRQWSVVVAYYPLTRYSKCGLDVRQLKDVLQAVGEAGFKPYFCCSDSLSQIRAACNEEDHLFILRPELNPLNDNVLCIFDIIHAINLARKYIITELIDMNTIPELFKLKYRYRSKQFLQFYDTNTGNYAFNRDFFSSDFVHLQSHTEDVRDILQKLHNLLNSNFAKYEFEKLVYRDIETIDEYVQFFMQHGGPLNNLAYALMGIKAAATTIFPKFDIVNIIKCRSLTTVWLEQLFSIWRHNYPIRTTSLYPTLYLIGRLYSQYYIAGNPYKTRHFQYISDLEKEMEIFEINF
ncbi:uncharacterized protein LOC142239105 [Haematobia irritans]|uniref:uncharacterized protein LOC142239105 n=1 Tax=Haematobia irritans TaxID=7368 RepID=UPI003F4FDC60